MNDQQREGQREQERNIRKINQYFDGKIENKTFHSHDEEKSRQQKEMSALIRDLNYEQMPGFTLQVLKRKVQQDYVLMENKPGGDQELALERFKELF